MASVHTSRKSGFVYRAGGRRRETLWIGGVGVATTITAGSTAVLMTQLNAAGLALSPFTIVRTRGYVHLSTDNVQSTEFQAAALGFAVVSDEASAIGITAVPTPITDSASDLFFVYQMMLGRIGFITSGMAQVGVGYEIDSKAMRKVEDGQDIIQVVETDLAAMTSGVTIRSNIRTLIKLH